MILSYKMVGGFAGFDDEINIFSDNSYVFLSRLKKNQTSQLLPNEINELKILSNKFGNIRYETPKEDSPVIDGIYSKVIFNGNNFKNNGNGLEDVSSFAVRLIYRIK